MMIFSFTIINCVMSQAPTVKLWDKKYGANDFDIFSCSAIKPDGGNILGGSSTSGINGDKTEDCRGGADFWIVNTTYNGQKIWDRRFGGTSDDAMAAVLLDSVGEIILAGTSYSGVGADKSEGTRGERDFWIVKTDSSGNKIWDKRFGGDTTDILTSGIICPDGNYLFGGYSLSGIGGDKSSPNWDTALTSFDYWIIKIDTAGNKIWDKRFGGLNNDWLYGMDRTNDGGFILGGYSASDVGGDKTQPSWGYFDFWIVKIDSLGNLQWDRRYGGTNYDELYSIRETNDQGFIMGGLSNSDIGGDKAQNTWGLIYADLWILKTDALGNIEWQRDLGGTMGEDEFSAIYKCDDGGFLINCNSYSGISGDKTEINLGQEQDWIIKIDSSGNTLWDKTIFTPGHDEYGITTSESDGCVVVAVSTNGGAGGYKSEPLSGFYDYWIVKLCDSMSIAVAALTSQTNICSGTCVDYVNLSVNATSYHWSFPGASPDTSTAINPTNICYAHAGSYDVQLIATNANGSDTILLTNYITVFPTPPPQSITQSGDTLLAIAGTGSYQWYFNGNIINGATDYFYVAPSSGDYNVVATDANGCEVEAAVFNVVAGMLSTVDRGLWTIFPNPVQDKLVVRGSESGGTAIGISVYNMMGEIVYLPVDRRLLTVDCRLLPSGLYYLEITSGQQIFRTRFVKN